jgi:predicted MFS family arabinose efflux permease
VILALMVPPLVALVAAAEMPMYIAILPRERFGQFGSANQIVCALTIIAGSVLAGQFIDWMTMGGTRLTGYRYLYLWQFFCQFFALISMIFLYRSWRRHGGPANYIPPNVGPAPGSCDGNRDPAPC